MKLYEKGPWHVHRRQKLPQDVVSRRQRIVELFEQGMDRSEIANLLGIDRKVIVRDLVRIRDEKLELERKK